MKMNASSSVPEEHMGLELTMGKETKWNLFIYVRHVNITISMLLVPKSQVEDQFLLNPVRSCNGHRQLMEPSTMSVLELFSMIAAILVLSNKLRNSVMQLVFSYARDGNSLKAKALELTVVTTIEFGHLRKMMDAILAMLLLSALPLMMDMTHYVPQLVKFIILHAVLMENTNLHRNQMLSFLFRRKSQTLVMALRHVSF